MLSLLLIVSLVFVAIVMCIYDLPKLMRKDAKREVVVYSLTIFLGLVIHITSITLPEIPGVLNLIMATFRPIHHLFTTIIGSS